MAGIEYIPCKQEHLRLIAPQKGFEQAQLVYANPVMKDLFDNNFSISAWLNNRCIGASGLITLYPHYAMAWAFVSKDAGPNMLQIVRKIRSVLDTQTYRRVEMRVKLDYAEGHKLAGLCGFKEEVPFLEASGFFGEDEVQYVRIKK